MGNGALAIGPKQPRPSSTLPTLTTSAVRQVVSYQGYSCRDGNVVAKAAPVEWPGGLSPPGSPRTVREPLDSYGSCCSAVSMTQLAVSEELRICTTQLRKPIPRPFGLVAQPFELPTRPADDIDVDPLQGRTQLRPIEVAVVVDPALNVRIVHLGQFLQGLVAAMMKRPPPNCLADGLQRFWASGGQEARKGTMPSPQRFSHSEFEPKKVKRLVCEVAAPVRILAVDYLRLLGMQHQLAGRKAVSKCAP